MVNKQNKRTASMVTVPRRPELTEEIQAEEQTLPSGLKTNCTTIGVRRSPISYQLLWTRNQIQFNAM